MEDWKEIEEQMRLRIWGGFDTAETFKQWFLVDYVTDWRNPDNRAPFEALVDRLFGEFREEQKSWEFPTDHDLLQQAFAELERQGVMVLQNMKGTSSSAPYEALDELKERSMEFEVIYRLQRSGIIDAFDELEIEDKFYYGWLDSKPVKIEGYVYYTGHHVDKVIENGKLYLGYQDFYNDLKIKQDIAEAIFRTLKDAGLQVAWEGEASRKIEVHMKWQKRE
ncbi:DUF6891 domain-containing protein [Deinococcus cellulosilyticus]|uniref:DUF6891 domain-containing protein n=1 Tax=Deinococcus cellulosilyticus (strain DSM 18568 / NBRC 106333 / KACC 11606 / 5516J-15) TaxID=1223518 RepID=A0A511N146_DEIC1|nr:hypothetical protein [Deinococcus cellulosilyticus]GEM46603.1 hypothetical protein DC3_22380 [Deinococcus cellulosilyticus NBRC 106333 = KACC 11606]